MEKTDKAFLLVNIYFCENKPIKNLIIIMSTYVCDLATPHLSLTYTQYYYTFSVYVALSIII